MSAAVVTGGGARALASAGRRRWHRCSCGRPIPEGVRRCSSRTCPEYAPTWARDTRRRLMENLRVVPLTVMFSVTAPGADLYPFDPRFCSHSPSQDALVLSAAGSIRRPRRRSTGTRAAGGASYTGRRRRGLTARQGTKGSCGAGVGEAETRTRPCARRHRRAVAGRASLGGGVRDGAA